jgi:sugar O-acyltransferase (sialic acid O-acetyltransferase NeuD family)
MPLSSKHTRLPIAPQPPSPTAGLAPLVAPPDPDVPISTPCSHVLARAAQPEVSADSIQHSSAGNACGVEAPAAPTARVVWLIWGAGAQGRVTLELLRDLHPNALVCLADDDPCQTRCAVAGVPVLDRAAALAWARQQPLSTSDRVRPLPRTPPAAPSPQRHGHSEAHVTDVALPASGDAHVRLLVAVGHNHHRLRLASELAAAGLRFGTLIHPSAALLRSATVGEGSVVGPCAVVGSGARVGPHVLIGSGSVVEHDCVLEEGAALAPGVRMAGRVHICRTAFVGVGATLCPRVRIGEGAIVGAGAVVTRHVPDGMLAFGVPARVVRAVDVLHDWSRML